jgi:hypothetical protein
MILRTLLAFCIGCGLSIASAGIQLPAIFWPVSAIVGGLIITYILKENKKDWYSYFSGSAFGFLGWVFFSAFMWPIFFR